MAKVMKFGDKVKKIKRSTEVYFNTDDGEVIGFEIASRSEAVIDSINAKYEAKKPTVPTKRLPSASGKPKIVENPDDPKYRTELAKVQKENFAELALNFLVEEERPEGELEEQLKQIMEVELAGFVPKIVQRGLEISAVIEEKDNYDEEVAEAKND